MNCRWGAWYKLQGNPGRAGRGLCGSELQCTFYKGARADHTIQYANQAPFHPAFTYVVHSTWIQSTIISPPICACKLYIVWFGVWPTLSFTQPGINIAEVEPIDLALAFALWNLTFVPNIPSILREINVLSNQHRSSSTPVPRAEPSVSTMKPRRQVTGHALKIH